MDSTAAVAFMVSLAQKAGEIQMANHGKPYTTEWERQHLRTEIDRLVGAMARKEIGGRYPTFAIMSEEVSPKEGGEMIFVVDEIDGTNPYFRGFSDHFTFSVGLCKDTTPIAGVVYAPKRGELYVGSEKGAFCNGEPIRVAKTRETDRVLMSIVSGKDNRDSHVPYVQRATGKDGIGDVVNFGSASMALCLVACGKLDAFLGTSLEPEDMAGAVPILLAAGAQVTDLRGQAWKLGGKNIFATNPELHEKLSELFGLRKGGER